MQSDGLLTLAQWRKRFPGGVLPEETAIDVIVQLSAALHKAHIESPFHRDIVPSTIMVEDLDDGSYRFSVPKLPCVAENHGEPGALKYLAPEQWWGARQNTASDQYALAVLFVDMVTGRVPFASAFETQDESVMRKAVSDHMPKIPEEMSKRKVIMRALSKDPRARFHSCSSFVAALTAKESEESHRHSGDDAHGKHHEAHDDEHDFRGKEREVRHVHVVKKPFPFFKAMFAAVAVIAGIVWGVNSGFFAEISGAKEASAQRRLAAIREERENEERAKEEVRKESIERLKAEIKSQSELAGKALTNLQEFLEGGGAAVIAVKRDTIAEKRKRLARELKALQSETGGVRELEQALAALASRTVPYDQVRKSIPSDSEVARNYEILVKGASSLKDLSGRFTDKHPNVVSQKKAVNEAFANFNDAVSRALKQVRDKSGDDLKKLSELQVAIAAVEEEYVKISSEYDVAQFKQKELERVRELESKRLADLRRKEFDLLFGSRLTTGD